MRVLFFGGYDPASPRPRVLAKGLARNGVEVVHCRTTARRMPFAYLDLSRRFPRGLDAVLVCEPGQHFVPMARWLARTERTPIVFDALFSEYDTYVFDRRTVGRYSLGALRYFGIDKLSCALADRVIVDTDLNARYFHRTFGTPAERLSRVFVGSDDDVFRPGGRPRDNGTFLVTFVGSYIPLQGVDHILRAAKILGSEADVRFLLIGRGQTYPSAVALAARLGLRNVMFQPSVAYEDLPRLLSGSDVSLGIFGDSEKARRVIPTKVFDALAMGKPLITGQSPAATEAGLVDRENAYLVEMSSPAAIAQAIRDARSDDGLRAEIAERGHRLFQDRFTPTIIGAELKRLIGRLVASPEPASSHSWPD